MKNETSTKELILKAAEKLFSTNGFPQTKISDISSIVGVSESTIYEHFENKEDILFTIPKKNTQKLININEQHLRGLVGAEIKLRKLIWNYLEFLSNNINYTKLLLFELRPNRFFYETESQKQIKKFTRIYRETIIEGQSKGEFLLSLSPSLILNLIFGTIDLIMITEGLKSKLDDATAYFDDLFNLIVNAITPKKIERDVKDKKKQILNAATTIFSQIGYNKARIQDIAKLADVGDGTIYSYFRNKEEILFTLPIENTKELISINREHLNGIKDSDLKLTVLINDYLNFFDNNKEYAWIVLFELRYNRDFYQTEAYNLFREFARIFYETILDGIEKKHFREKVNPYIAVKMIFGVIDHSILSWLIFGRPEKIINLSDPICNLILSALKV